MVSTPPGWFPDPSGVASLRWWDGARWTGYVMAGPGTQAAFWAGQARAAGEAEERMVVWAVRVVRLGVLSMCVFAAAFLVGLRVFAGDLRSLGFGNFTSQGFVSFGTRLQVLSPGQLAVPPTWTVILPFIADVLAIVVIVLFLVWQHRAASTARCLGYPAALSPALGVGSWFIPIVNFWFPYQALRDMLPPGHVARPLVLRAWLCYVITPLLMSSMEISAFFSFKVSLVMCVLLIVVSLVVCHSMCRVVRAVSADHAEAIHRI
ncbi:MAG: DUF2510 domain-containing protein [Acidimicrobiales bacterium]